MNYLTSGFPRLQHNELHDFTASLLSEVCYNVSVEPPLQPLIMKAFLFAAANVEDGACLYVAVSGFWGSPSEGFHGC